MGAPGAKVSDVVGDVKPRFQASESHRSAGNSLSESSGETTNRRMSKRRGSLMVVADLQAAGALGSPTAKGGRNKDVERTRVKQTPHRMNLRKTSLTANVINTADFASSAPSSYDIRTKPLHLLDEDDGHCLGKEVVNDFFQCGRRPKVCMEAAKEKYKALGDFIAGSVVDGRKEKKALG